MSEIMLYFVYDRIMYSGSQEDLIEMICQSDTNDFDTMKKAQGTEGTRGEASSELRHRGKEGNERHFRLKKP